MAAEPATHQGTGTQHSSNSSHNSSDARSVTVLVDYHLEDSLLQSIQALDPRLRVLTTYERAQGDGEGTSLENKTRVGDPELGRLLAQAEVLFGFGFPVDSLKKAPDLEWVQLTSAGSDNVLRAGVFDICPSLILTTASGIHEVPISEHILATMLFFARRFNVAVRNQPLHNWQRYQGGELFEQTVLLVGYGAISRRTALYCKTLGMRVLVVRASIQSEQPGEGPVDRFYPTAELNRAIAQADYVVLAAPRTPETEGMIGKEQFAAMKPSAVLVNISRGALVDEAALTGALVQNKIGGAALDVFAQEPLPAASPLWDLPNVLVTPHIAGSNPRYNERATALFRDNLRRYLKGEPLKNRVDRERGY